MNDKIAILPLRRAQLPPKPKRQVKRSTSEGITSEDTSDASVRRKRASKPKVRTGCSTCKIRRVKCDETKPACTKCTSTGRKCDGYVEPQPKRRRPSPVANLNGLIEPGRSLDFVKGTDNELYALDFFRNRTAPNMGMYFDAEFWGRLVMQMGLGEPAIKHALVAVGALHRQREHCTQALLPARSIVVTDPVAMSLPSQRSALDSDDPVALEHYNKAIQMLRARGERHGDSAEVALLACILFVCFEFLRGDVEPALKHFRGGMGIIMGSYGSRAATTQIRNLLLPFFNRLELLSTLFGNDSSWSYPIQVFSAVPDTFESGRQARDTMVHLMNLSLRFIRSMKYLKHDPYAITTEHLAEQAHLKTQLYRWRSVFEKHLAATKLQLTPDDVYAANILEIHRLVALTWVTVCASPCEARHDAHMAEFEAIVSLSEQMLTIAGTRRKQPQQSSTFLFDMEIVSPLYWVGVKCRHPSIRRRAIALLRSVHRREGLWDSNMAAAVAARVMCIEEGGLEKADSGNLPPETSRIHNALVQSESGMNPLRHMITFQMKPDGLDGYWKIWQEQIILEPDSRLDGAQTPMPGWDKSPKDSFSTSIISASIEGADPEHVEFGPMLSEAELSELFPYSMSPRASY